MFRKCLSLQVSQTWSLDFLPRHVWHSLWPWLGTETSCNGSRPGASISATTPPGWSTTGGERNGYSQRYTRRSGNPPVGLWGTDALFLLCFLLFPFSFSFPPNLGYLCFQPATKVGRGAVQLICRSATRCRRTPGALPGAGCDPVLALHLCPGAEEALQIGGAGEALQVGAGAGARKDKRRRGQSGSV